MSPMDLADRLESLARCAQSLAVANGLREIVAELRSAPHWRHPYTPEPYDPLVPMLGNKPASTANDCQLEHSLWAVRLVDSGAPNGVKPKDLEGYRAQVGIGTKRTCPACLTVLEPDLPVEQRAARWSERIGINRL